jgi:tRNA-dihydrouridine synthase B
LTIPLTVKFRLGLDERRESFLELGRICEANGVDAVALHARTARQAFRGTPRWPAIGELKAALNIPVIGNGDVTTAEDAVRMMATTGCDGVMVGRGATRNPWLFRQISARLSPGDGGHRWSEPSLEERRDLVLGHFRTLAEREDELFALHKMRLFTKWYSTGLPEGLRLRRQIQKLSTTAIFIEAVERFFAELTAGERHDAA